MYKSITSFSAMALSAVCFMLTACNDTTLATKSFEESLEPLTIPGFPASFGELTLPAIKYPLDLQDQPGYSSLDIVTSVRLRSAVFTISPETDNPKFDQFADNNPDNFDFLSSITLSLEATINGAISNLQVASLPEGDPQLSSDSKVLSLILDDVDIRDYVEAPDVKLVVVASGTNPVDFVVIDPVVRFRVGVGVR